MVKVRSGSVFNVAVNVNTCTIENRFKYDTCSTRVIPNLGLMSASTLLINHMNVQFSLNIVV